MTDDAPEPTDELEQKESGGEGDVEPAPETGPVQVAVRLTRADFDRLVAHRARMREKTPAQFVGLANALRDVIHRGLDVADGEAALAGSGKGEA